MEFLIDNIVLASLVVLSGSMLLLSALRKPSNRLSILQAVKLINQGRTIILDVRHSETFSISHLKDAKNISLEELSHRTAELDKFRKKSILVVCQSGSQSPKAARKLSCANFRQVYYLEGGITAWQSRGLPTTEH